MYKIVVEVICIEFERRTERKYEADRTTTMHKRAGSVTEW